MTDDTRDWTRGEDAPSDPTGAARPEPAPAPFAPLRLHTADAPGDDAPWPPAPARRSRGAWAYPGLVAAAATAGAIVAFGFRDDANGLAPFATAGRLLLGIAPTQGAAFTLLALVAGVVAHVAVCVVWGALFLALAGRRRGWHLALTAALLATLVYSASSLWLPRALVLGAATHPTRPQLVLLHALLAGGLWLGTRLAQLAPRDA